MLKEKCAKCGKEVFIEELVNFLCDDCYDDKHIEIVQGIPQLNDKTLKTVEA